MYYYYIVASVYDVTATNKKNIDKLNSYYYALNTMCIIKKKNKEGRCLKAI